MRASDHAVLRYLERKLGVNVEAARARIEDTFSPSRMQVATERAEGVGMRDVHDGMVFCCRGDTVTTCYRRGLVSGRRSKRGDRRARRRQARRSAEAGARLMRPRGDGQHRGV